MPLGCNEKAAVAVMYNKKNGLLRYHSVHTTPVGTSALHWFVLMCVCERSIGGKDDRNRARVDSLPTLRKKERKYWVGPLKSAHRGRCSLCVWSKLNHHKEYRGLCSNTWIKRNESFFYFLFCFHRARISCNSVKAVLTDAFSDFLLWVQLVCF